MLTIRLRFLLRNSQVGGYLFIFFSNPYDTLVFRVLMSSWLVSTKPNGSKGTEYSPFVDQCRIRVGVEDKHLLSHLLGQVTNTVQKIFFSIFQAITVLTSYQEELDSDSDKSVPISTEQCSKRVPFYICEILHICSVNIQPNTKILLSLVSNMLWSFWEDFRRFEPPW